MDRSELISKIVERTGMSEEAAKGAVDIMLESGAIAFEEMKVPPYFDRYVTSEIRRLNSEIEHLRVDMNKGFANVDKRFGELRQEMDRRFEGVEGRFKGIDRRFEEVDRRFEEVNRRFDRLERWFLTVGVPIVVGILAIIIEIFFRGV